MKCFIFRKKRENITQFLKNCNCYFASERKNKKDKC